MLTLNQDMVEIEREKVTLRRQSIEIQRETLDVLKQLNKSVQSLSNVLPGQSALDIFGQIDAEQ